MLCFLSGIKEGLQSPLTAGIFGGFLVCFWGDFFQFLAIIIMHKHLKDV